MHTSLWNTPGQGKLGRLEETITSLSASRGLLLPSRDSRLLSALSLSPTACPAPQGCPDWGCLGSVPLGLGYLKPKQADTSRQPGLGARAPGGAGQGRVVYFSGAVVRRPQMDVALARPWTPPLALPPLLPGDLSLLLGYAVALVAT